MSMITGKKEIESAHAEYQFNENIKTKIQKVLDQIKKDNAYSRKIMMLESSLEVEETAKMEGRLETVKCFLEELGYSLDMFDF